MAQKIIVQPKEWEKQENRFKYAEELEKGNILFFDQIPFSFPKEEIDFLLAQKQGDAKGRKNIAYKPQLDKVTNHEPQNSYEKEKMHSVLKHFSTRVVSFLNHLLAPYAPHWNLDYASFRPFQEKGRALRLRARNDLLHVDSFPTRSMNGARILRFFVNINPSESRNWATSYPFEELIQLYGGDKGVSYPRGIQHTVWERWGFWLRSHLKNLKLVRQVRSPYDYFMLQMHNFLKENEKFQKTSIKDFWEFPPHSCWAVFTDQVSHAALSGQYALEQTLFIPQKALLFPDRSPLKVLERMAGRNMSYTNSAV